MPQLQNIVLTDRQATPVNHTFIPREIDSNGVGTVIESNGVPVGDNRLSISRRLSAGKHKCQLRLTVPVVQNQTVNGITSPVVVRTAFVSAEFTFDEKSTEQERKDVVGMFYSSLDPSKVLVNDVLTKLQGVY